MEMDTEQFRNLQESERYDIYLRLRYKEWRVGGEVPAVIGIAMGGQFWGGDPPKVGKVTLTLH